MKLASSRHKSREEKLHLLSSIALIAFLLSLPVIQADSINLFVVAGAAVIYVAVNLYIDSKTKHGVTGERTLQYVSLAAICVIAVQLVIG